MGRVKVGPKKQTLDVPFLQKLKIWNIIKRFLFLLNYYLWRKFQQNWTVFEGIRIPKLPKKGPESVRKALKIFNLTNHECYTDKTYQDYLHKTFNLVKTWGVTHWMKRTYTKSIFEWAIKSAFWLNLYEHSDSSNNHNICYALSHIESLVKSLHKLDLIWRSNPWKNHPK